MNRIQLIARNIGVLFLSQIVSIILTFLYTVYAARYLGASGFGILSFAIAFTGIFVVLIDLGLNMLTVREVARDKSLMGKYSGNVIIIKIILALLTVFLIALTVNLVKYPPEIIIVVYLIGLSVIFGSFSGIFNAIFQANEKMEYQSLGQILNSFLMFLGALIIIYYGFGIYAFASLYLIVTATVLSYSILVCVWKFVIPQLEVDLNFWKNTIVEAFPFGLTNIFVLIYYYIDVVMLSIMIPNSNELIGWYSAAYMLVMPLSFVPSIFFTSVFPAMANFYKKSEKSLKFTFERSIRYMLILGLPIAVGITLLADKLFLLIYGLTFLPGVIALQILVWSVPLIFIDSAFTYLFNSINRQITVTKIMGVVAFINVVLNYLLIPYFSYIGASIVMVISDLVTLMFMVFVLRTTNYNIHISFIKDTLKVLISSLAMAISIIVLDDFNIILTILISAIVYIAIFLSLKGLDESDVKIIKSILSKD